MREAKNQLTIIGTLKSKEVINGVTAAGAETITVNLTIISETDGKIHENKVKLWAKETSKLAKGYHTVANEYKTTDKDGKENADRIKITGSLEMNEYVSRDGELKTFNNLRGVFVERVTDPNVKDEVGAAVECIVLGYIDEISKTGTPTGRKRVSLYTVGYNSSVHEFQNVFVTAELAQQFARLYQPNSTGRLFIKVHNYVEIEQNQQVPVVQPTLGFGTQLDNMPGDNVIKNYVNELVIIGGDMPATANRYTMEDITEMKKVRELATQEKMSVAPTPPAKENTPSGFGSGFETPEAPISDGDMPF